MFRHLSAISGYQTELLLLISCVLCSLLSLFGEIRLFDNNCNIIKISFIWPHPSEQDSHTDSTKGRVAAGFWNSTHTHYLIICSESSDSSLVKVCAGSVETKTCGHAALWWNRFETPALEEPQNWMNEIPWLIILAALVIRAVSQGQGISWVT